MDTHALLTEEPVLLLRPTLACALAHAGLTPGDRQALWTQQLHYWTEVHRKAGHRKTHFHDGRWWVWNSIDSWHAQFPFWSRSTIRRVIARSVRAGVTLSANYNRFRYDQTRWYTIDYDRLEEMFETWNASRAEAQNEPIHWVKVGESIASK